jgi:hypothetical protein
MNSLTGQSGATETYQEELLRLHKLNMELLEQFSVACDFLLKTGVQVPNASTFASLLNKSMSLLNEILTKEPQYSTSRRKVTGFRTDEEETEPHGCWWMSNP